MKSVLIVRYGALGDSIIITPILRWYKQQGYKVIVNTSSRGEQMLEFNPNVDEIILYKDNSVPNEKLEEHWDKLKKKVSPDLFINLSESLEVDIALHLLSPRYNWPKYKRKKYADTNYYEHTFKKCGIDQTDFKQEDWLPEMFLDPVEEEWAKKTLKEGTFNIVWGLSGSGKNKCWPWFEFVIKDLIKEYRSGMHFYLVGDESCKLLESGLDKHPNITCLSGKISMRRSIALVKYADLVVCPDTGLLHGAGCFKTPKIGLLGHTTIENITKHFYNDYSIEADPELSECAPCARLIYDVKVQCPTDAESGAAFCMHYGISQETVTERIKQVYEQTKKDNAKYGN